MLRSLILVGIFALLTIASPVPSNTTGYDLDVDHSTLEKRATHWVGLRITSSSQTTITPLSPSSWDKSKQVNGGTIWAKATGSSPSFSHGWNFRFPSGQNFNCQFRGKLSSGTQTTFEVNGPTGKDGNWSPDRGLIRCKKDGIEVQCKSAAPNCRSL